MNLVNFLDIIYSLFPFLARSNTFNNGNCHPEQQLHQSVGLMTIDSAQVTWTPSMHTQSTGIPACLSFFTIFWVPTLSSPPPPNPGRWWLQHHTINHYAVKISLIASNLWFCDLNVPVCFNLKCFKSKWFIFELVSEKKKKTTGFQILNQSICSAFILTSCRYKHPSTKNHKNNSYSCNMIPKLFYYSTEIIKQIGTINTQLLSTKCNFQFTFTFTDYVTL